MRLLPHGSPCEDGAITSNTTNKLLPGVRARAVRMVLNHEGDHTTRWAALSSPGPFMTAGLVHHSDRGCQYALSSTRNGWRRPASSRQLEALAFPTTMLSPKRSMDFTRPRSFIGVDRGEVSRSSRSPLWNGSTGSITAGCLNQSATSRQPRQRRAITPHSIRPPCRSDLSKNASGKPGAVQNDQSRYPRNIRIGYFSRLK
jgi:hypothetical protein